MSLAHPKERIQFAFREVERYREDVHCWHQRVLEDLIAKANFLYVWILKLDEELQGLFLSTSNADAQIQEDLRRVLSEWLDASVLALHYANELKTEHSRVEGAEVLETHVKQAWAILTPDDAYFADAELWSLREQAVESHRMGQTEPLLDNERVH